ncbi:helix-turn-helix transcriptional regulator [Allohahella sp. A8]|uniref:helix-turn-helix transcriptional regulator n=1 Tax=Allohahella sp. A8 TaxID=3141461 RepID=UPI003A80D0B5
MQTFVRRLAILDYLRRTTVPRSTEAILAHLQDQGYLEESDEQRRNSQLRVVQRDLKFLLGDDPGFFDADPAEADDELEEPLNPFGLRSVPAAGKGRAWMLDPLDRQRFDFEKMPGYLAVAFAMTAKHLSNLLPQSTLNEMTAFFAEAERVLQRSERKLAPQHYLRLRDSIEFYQRGQSLESPDFDMRWLDTIYQAIIRAQQIELVYSVSASNGSTTKTYRLSPLGVVLMLPKLYLVSLNEAGEFRHFLLHRIRRVELLRENFADEDFSLQAYLDAGHMDVFIDDSDRGDYDLVLAIKRQQGDKLIEDLSDYPLNATQSVTLESASEAIVRVRVRRTIQLRNWILSLGSRATVLQPEIIRQDIRSVLTASLQNYN